MGAAAARAASAKKHEGKRTMKALLLGLCLSFSLGAFATPQHPALSEVSGQAWVTGVDGHRLAAKNKQRLVEKATLETSENGSLRVSLDAKRSFILFENSQVILPAISWETGEAPVIVLKKGRFEWISPVGEKNSFNVALRSDLFEFIAPQGDFIFSYNPEKALVGVEVLVGSMEFFPLNGDETVKIHAGEKAGFQGVFENGEIAYDILLKGRKIPRGHLTTVEKFKASSAIHTKPAATSAQNAAAKAAAEADKPHAAICTKPAGRFNQCAWVCEGNSAKEKKACRLDLEGVSCVRRRCNANGVWAEPTPLDAEKTGKICQANAVVAPCDY